MFAVIQLYYTTIRDIYTHIFMKYLYFRMRINNDIEWIFRESIIAINDSNIFDYIYYRSNINLIESIINY